MPSLLFLFLLLFYATQSSEQKQAAADHNQHVYSEPIKSRLVHPSHPLCATTAQGSDFGWGPKHSEGSRNVVNTSAKIPFHVYSSWTGQITHSTLCQRLFHHQPFPSVKRIVKQNGHSSHSRLKHVQYVASVLLNSLSSLFSLPTPMLAVNCHFL